MFDKLDDVDCVVKTMELPTTNNGGDRSSVNQSFVFCCRSQANVAHHPQQIAFAYNRSTLDGRCAWALLGTGLLLCGAVYATTASGNRVDIQLDNISIGE